MTPQEIEESLKQQNNESSEVSLNKRKDLKTKYENENARYVLRKQIIPFTKWYLETIKDPTIQIELNIGDQLELIDLDQSFLTQNGYKGTTRNTVININAKYVELATPESYRLLIGEDYKIFMVNKPLYKNEFDSTNRMISMLEQQMVNQNKGPSPMLLIGMFLLISILIILGFMLT